MTNRRIPKLKEMNEIVAAELEWIPKDRGNLAQQMLRSNYQFERMHSLGKKGKGESKEYALKKALASVKEKFPEFEPDYFEEKFDLD